MPLEQTAAVAAPPSLALPTQIVQRINPSPELQQKVTAAIEACTQWHPETMSVTKTPTAVPQASTAAQVCDVLDRWPVIHNGQVLSDFSIGVFIAVSAAAVWMIAQAVLRRALDMAPASPIAKHFMVRVAGGALCGVGIATFSVLLTMPRFVAATFEQTAENARQSWSSTTPWAAGVFAVLFALSAVPGGWWRQALLATRPRVASRWSHRED